MSLFFSSRWKTYLSQGMSQSCSMVACCVSPVQYVLQALGDGRESIGFTRVTHTSSACLPSHSPMPLLVSSSKTCTLGSLYPDKACTLLMTWAVRIALFSGLLKTVCTCKTHVSLEIWTTLFLEFCPFPKIRISIKFVTLCFVICCIVLFWEGWPTISLYVMQWCTVLHKGGEVLLFLCPLTAQYILGPSKCTSAICLHNTACTGQWRFLVVVMSGPWLIKICFVKYMVSRTGWKPSSKDWKKDRLRLLLTTWWERWSAHDQLE